MQQGNVFVKDNTSWRSVMNKKRHLHQHLKAGFDLAQMKLLTAQFRLQGLAQEDKMGLHTLRLCSCTKSKTLMFILSQSWLFQLINKAVWMSISMQVRMFVDTKPQPLRANGIAKFWKHCVHELFSTPDVCFTQHKPLHKGNLLH